MRQPVKDPRSGLWLARYTAPDGRVMQAGRFERKRDAQKAIAKALERDISTEVPSFVEFFAQWPERFPGNQRTKDTNQERISRYIIPYLPRKGQFPLTDLRRSTLRDVQAQLLGRGLSKETIDGAFSSLSAMLRDAGDDELLTANVAHGFRVRPNDPRLKPKKQKRERRAVPPDEVGAFMAQVPARHLAVCWAPFLTGCRPGELFALMRPDLDRSLDMIFVHQTVDRYGHLQAGTKTTHHISDRESRGRWTLFPESLVAMSTAASRTSTAGFTHPLAATCGDTGTSTATCGSWPRRLPEPNSPSTTPATRSHRDFSRRAFPWSTYLHGWVIRSGPAAQR